MAVITVSAAYGAGGSEIAPQVARRLRARFIDRAIPVGIARDLGISVEEAEAVARNAPNRLWRAFAAMSGVSYGLDISGPGDQLATEHQLIEQTEARIRDEADAGGCVILGHAAAVILAGRGDILHVRLDGAPAGRIQAAMRQHGIDHDAATAAQKQNDKLRTGYVKHFYQADSTSPSLYDLVLDTVRLGWARAEKLIIAAAGLVETPAAGSDFSQPT